MTPLVFIGEEIKRKAQEGEDIGAIEDSGPIRYAPGQTRKTRAADAALILRAKKFWIRQLMRESGAGQHVVERFLRGERVHPSSRTRLTEAVEQLERATHTQLEGKGRVLKRSRFRQNGGNLESGTRPRA